MARTISQLTGLARSASNLALDIEEDLAEIDFDSAEYEDIADLLEDVEQAISCLNTIHDELARKLY